ncbi:hypothetical protein QYM36_004469 [Artemia franciscana]|uniref:phosphatidylinositol-3,4-bisphosphate 4-phosphatase n=1 Tax=Artemia franciscana TaxID=6661 RepID=A0AA88I5J1_ARTSF|nr:hypothetical protein QYM36_004469 [Artemia franciscana]
MANLGYIHFKVYVQAKSYDRFGQCVFVERWCRLRGNLLFYLKSHEPFSEAYGVIVLDIAEIRLEADSPSTGPFYFSITMGPDKSELILGASTSPERDSWIQSLHMASYSYVRAQADSLKIRLTELQAKIKTKEDEENSVCIVGDRPSIEVGIGCDNLRCDANGYPPDAKIVVGYRSKSCFFWNSLCETETVKSNSNPCFLRTACFTPSITDKSKDILVRFTVHEVKEVSTNTTIVIGHCELPVQKLLESEKIRLPVLSQTKSPVGFISLTIWTPVYSNKSESLAGTPKRASPEHESKRFQKGHRRAHSLPPKLSVKLQLPSTGIGTKLLTNTILRTYRFHSGLGGDIFVHESLLESKIHNCIPTQLL